MSRTASCSSLYPCSQRSATTGIPQFENHAVWKTVILAAETLLKQLAK